MTETKLGRAHLIAGGFPPGSMVSPPPLGVTSKSTGWAPVKSMRLIVRRAVPVLASVIE